MHQVMTMVLRKSTVSRKVHRSRGPIYDVFHFVKFLDSCLVRATVAGITNRGLSQFVDVKWSTILTKILIVYLQPVERSLKQTFLEISPSSTAGWAPSNQPDHIVPHLYAGPRVLGILVPVAPTKRYQPPGSSLSHSDASTGVM